ncbi:putative multidrug resistance protein [Vibrio ishigakensis]|uniref:Putative multidrug resistance protein n=1 Tax=Vibrio ishigakensis TaxID=1481914 RepID=A0A0B8NPE3_9VIBR|nr:MFS transporter [Vibrio ishigakensis]GAM56445.1 putative multidrug resistance protein [Vibrio ishigakensis]
MADKLGKKNIALIGLVTFALSSFAIANVGSSDSFEFLGLRALQSFGGSACFTAIFALIRMRFEGENLNKAYSYLNGILAFVPVSAPLIGAYIVAHSSWFVLFEIMAVLGALSLVWIFFMLPAEKADTSSSVGTSKASLVQGYLSVLANARFRTYLFFALIAQTLFIYLLTVAPMYLMGSLDMSQVAFGEMFMVIAIVFMVGSFLSPKINQMINIQSLVKLSLVLIVAGGAMMFLMSGIAQWYSLIVPMVIIAFGCTMLLSSSPANALAELKESAGVASGLYTATTFGMGAVISALVANFVDSADLSQVSLVYTLFALLALVVFFFNESMKKA